MLPEKEQLLLENCAQNTYYRILNDILGNILVQPVSYVILLSSLDIFHVKS